MHPTTNAVGPGVSQELDSPETSVHDLPNHYRELRLRGIPPEELEAARQTILQDLDPDHPRYQAFLHCRALATFRRHTTTGEVAVFGSACRHRWCPICARQRGRQIADAAYAWLRGLTHRRFITLTLQHHSTPLDDQLDALIGFFRTLRRRQEWRRYVRGGLWFIQVTWSDARQEWHPHIHLVADSDYWPKGLLSRIWREVTHGSTIVDVQTVKQPERAARYVSRYVARPAVLSDLPEECRLLILQATRSRRLCGAFGTAHAAAIFARPKLDLADWEYLGSYEEVRALASSCDDARIILLAWMLKRPIQPLDEWKALHDDIEGKPPPPVAAVMHVEQHQFAYAYEGSQAWS